jgi:predicted phage terminase large subunit-like protein
MSVSDIAKIVADPETQKHLALASPEYRLAWAWRMSWFKTQHKHQTLPPGDWWSIWLMLAGRGAGKTRTAAEQIAWWAYEQPGTRWLVAAPTSADVRATCFEGDSGLMTVVPKSLIADYNKTAHELRLINGSLIKGIPASEPERFRGPQFHGGWCDELAAWDYIQEAWDQIQFGMRLGKRTRMICTTTPRPKDLIIELMGREGDDVVMTTASTYANLGNLSDNFRKQILAYEGTKLGRQEIYAEIIDPEEGGIVKRDMFKLWPAGRAFPKFEYILQSYDVATSEKAQNDPTACITFGVFKPQDGPMSAMVIDCWQERMMYPDLRPKVIEEYETVFGEGKDRKRVDLLLIEDKSAGISLIQDLQRAHLPVRAYNPGRADKLQRLNIVSNVIARGRVWIPESDHRKGYVKDWAEGFVSQICSFPETTHDDLVDACVDSLTQVQMAKGVKLIKDVQVGDMVMTPAGPRKVTAVHDNGLKEVWSVNGLLATAEHRVMTQQGWVRVDALQPKVHSIYESSQSAVCSAVDQVFNTHTMRHVFDLTVEGEHCYYANGILVHNCTQALRYLRDAGWLDIDPLPDDTWDEDDYADTGRVRKVNPYAI